MDKRKASQIIKEVKEQYNTIAKDWDASRFRPTEHKAKIVKNVKTGENVLDLGSGNSLILENVLAQNAHYFGFDISKELIKVAKDKYRTYVKNKQAEFKSGDATKKLPYDDSFFDVVLSFAVLHHVPTHELRLKFLQAIYRVLKVGGWAAINVWNLKNEWSDKRFKITEQLSSPSSELESGDVRVSWKATGDKILGRYLHVFEPKELEDLARAAGFDKISVEFYNRAGEKEQNGEELLLIVKK